MKRGIYIFFVLFCCYLLKAEVQGGTSKKSQDIYVDNLIKSVEKGAVLSRNSNYALSQAKEDNLPMEGDLQNILFYTMLISTSVLLLLTTTLTVGRKRMRTVNKQLKAKNAEIRQKNNVLEELHAKLHKQHEAIDEQRKALEEMNRVKDKMFSIIAHDFRSPLNTIQGVLNLLHMDVLTPEELKSMLPHLSQKVDHSISLLDNLLNWARTQMNGLKVNIITFTLAPEVDETIGIISQLAHQKNIRIERSIEKGSVVHADPDMIQLVIRNLLSNAIKFTKPGGIIRISTQQQENTTTISVSDTGIGMSQSVIQELFKQTGYSTKGTAQEKGTGLGLLLCNEFVRRNGGEIWVESKEGKGTTFHFTVPVAEVIPEPSYN